MQIYTPKNSETGGGTEWETVHIDESSITKKNALVTFQEYFKAYSALSSKTKDMSDSLDASLNRITLAEEKAEKILKETESIKSLLYVGFLALLLVVAGLVFSYIEFVYSGSKNDDYKYSLTEKVSNNENEIKLLKQCLFVSKWLNPKCF